MMTLLLKLLGGRLDQVQRIIHMSLSVGGGVGVAWVIAGAAILVAMTIIVYRRTADQIGPLRRYSLTVLRSLLLIFLLILLLRPTLTLTVAGSSRRTLLFLIDATKSMSIGDLRSDRADAARALIAAGKLDPAGGLNQSFDPNADPDLTHITREALLKAALTNPKLHLLQSLSTDYNIEADAFADTLHPLPITKPTDPSWLNTADPTGTTTAIGDAVRDVLHQKRGQPMAGIVLISDGGNNRGMDPADAAALASDQQVPIFSYGVGIASPKDIAVTNIFTEPVAFSNDALPVAVRVKSTGMIGKTARLNLTLGKHEVASKEITFDHDGEMVVNMKFTPGTPGEYELTASIPPRSDEAVKDNNSTSEHLKVIDGKIKVLLVDSAPRWDFKYLQELLLRDPRCSLKCVLTESDPGIAKGPNSPYLAKFPTDRKTLFNFDLIIIGDVPKETFGADGLQLLSEFVNNFGGAVTFIAGRRFDPAVYAGTVAAKMLPVEFDPQTVAAAGQADPVDPTRLELTEAGLNNPMLAVSDSDSENKARWKAFPGVYWVCPITKPKPGAQVLAVDSNQARASRYGKMPIIAIQDYGLGQVMFIGTDETWRWRKNEMEPYHDEMWSQIVQRLGLPHLLGLSQKIQLTADKRKYSTGDQVTIYARVYGDDFQPVNDETVTGSFRQVGGSAGSDVVLRKIPDQPGVFRGEFVVPAPGDYNVSLQRDPKIKLALQVTEPTVEMGETAMNEPLLKQMADASGGSFFREEDLYQLPEKIREKSAQVQTTLDVDLWSSPAYYLLILGLASGEWILRKTAQLK
ncbi:MAG TPA: hypothetical protein VHY37_01530 [Tepidisphaeraceae bacterium]|jgi:hypothetical protein|nr:hypothetical protein [Tepidisphaeraceae bacterium]